MRDGAIPPAFIEPIVVEVPQSSDEVIAGWRQKHGPRTWSIRQVSQAKVNGRRGVIRSFEEQSRKLGQRGAREREQRGHPPSPSTVPSRVASFNPASASTVTRTCTRLRLMSYVATTRLLVGTKTTCTPILPGPLMVRALVLSSSLDADPGVMMSFFTSHP